MQYGEITVERRHELIQSKPSLLVLGVRTKSEFEEGHTTGAVNISVQELETRLGELDRSVDYLVYCRTGNRSSIAVQTLGTHRFEKVYHMVSGIDGWVGAGYLLER
jgi:phage shock protein E